MHKGKKCKLNAKPTKAGGKVKKPRRGSTTK